MTSVTDDVRHLTWPRQRQDGSAICGAVSGLRRYRRCGNRSERPDAAAKEPITAASGVRQQSLKEDLKGESGTEAQ